MSNSFSLRPDRPSESDLDLVRVSATSDWDDIARLTIDPGAVIVEQLFDDDLLRRFDDDVDRLIRKSHSLAPRSGDDLYDMFLGSGTIRFHGLAAQTNSADALIGDQRLVRWAQQTMTDVCSSVLLNAGELIQIGPGEPAQFLHRDSDSWPAALRGGAPIVVNAIVALHDFTLENGATHIAPGTALWPNERQPQPHDFSRAVMRRGDAVLFRGDLVHGGGANVTDRPRRALSLSYCAGWLRTVENHQLNIPPDQAVALSETTQALIGYAAHNATAQMGGMLGLFNGGQPANALKRPGAL